MHDYTKSGNWTLKVEIMYNNDKNGNPSSRVGTWGIGEWDNFAVADEMENYRLTIGNRTKTVNMESYDPFGYHNKMYFTTNDNDNDNYSGN